MTWGGGWAAVSIAVSERPLGAGLASFTKNIKASEQPYCIGPRSL